MITTIMPNTGGVLFDKLLGKRTIIYYNKKANFFFSRYARHFQLLHILHKTPCDNMYRNLRFFSFTYSIVQFVIIHLPAQ